MKTIDELAIAVAESFIAKEDLYAEIRQLLEETAALEMDCDRCAAIIDGSWPTADGCIEMARKRRAATRMAEDASLNRRD